MIRSLLFFFSFLLAFFASMAALPSLVDKVHLEKSLSLALGTDVTLERVDSFRLLPSPRIVTSGMRVLAPEDPEQAFSQSERRGFSPAMLGLNAAQSITLHLSWKRFLTDGSLDSLELGGAKLSPELDNARLMPLVRRLAARAQGADIEVNNTQVRPSRDGIELPAFDIETLTISTNADGDRRFKGRIRLAGSDAGGSAEPVAVGVDLSLKPLRYLGDGLLQSFDLSLSSNAASSPLGALSANLVGSMQFEDKKAPRLAATLVVKKQVQDQTEAQEPILQARLSWQDEALSMTDIVAQVAGWQLAGDYWPAQLASDEQPQGLTLVAAGLPSPVEGLADLPQRLQTLSGDLDRAFSLLELVGLGELPVALQIPRAKFGKLFVEDMDLVLRSSDGGYQFDRLSFNTIASGRFEARSGALRGDHLELEGQFRCASPSVMLAELGLQSADLRQRTSLPDLLADGRLSLSPEAVTLTLSQLALAGDSIAVTVVKNPETPWQVTASGGRLNADYLNQDLAPTQGLAEAPMAWLEQQLLALPGFVAELDVADLTLGGLALGSVQGGIAWRPEERTLTLGPAANGQQEALAFQVDNLLDAFLAVRGEVWFSDAPTGGIQALHKFAMLVRPSNERAFLPNRLLRDLGALANAASPFTLFTPATSIGVQEIKLTAELRPRATAVHLNADFRDGTSVIIDATLPSQVRLAEQTQRPLTADWSVENPRGLDLDVTLGADLAQLVPVPVTRVEGEQISGEDVGNYKLILQVPDGLATGQIRIDTYPSAEPGLAADLAAINRLDWVLDYGLSGLTLPRLASDVLLLDQPRQDFELSGQLSVQQQADGLRLTASGATIAGLRLESLLLDMPRAGAAVGTTDLSGTIKVDSLRLAGPGGADSLALWPLEALSGQKFSINLELASLELGAFAFSQVGLTALSDGVTLDLAPITARLGAQPLSGQARLSLGLLPQLQLSAGVDTLRQSASVKGTPLELEVGVAASVTALGTNLASMVKNANAEMEVSGFGMLRVSQPLALLADYAGRLALDLGPEKSLRFQELVFQALANKTLPLSGRLRWVDGALRSSAGLTLGGDQDYLRISGRLGLAGAGSKGEAQDLGSQDLDLDISLFGDDDLIPKAALEMTGTSRRPHFQAFGSALN